MWEFFFIKLLNTWPDCMLLAARTKGMADGDIVLVSYQVSRDRFRKLRIVPKNIVFLGCAGENMREAVFLFSNTEEKEIGTDEKKTARCFKETALVIVEEGMACICKKINIPVTVKDCFIEKIPGSRDGAYEVFLASDEEENDGVLVSRKEHTWMLAPVSAGEPDEIQTMIRAINQRVLVFQDSDIRKISAYMMGMEEFDAEAFNRMADYITAFPDGSLEIHFYDGRAERWQR